MPRILLADDRPEMRRLLRLRLELDDDLEVVGDATNGAEAVGLAHARQPDAVVLDLEMPVMDGGEAIPLLRRAAPEAVIVLYTAAAVIDLAATAQPDAVVDKVGDSLEVLVTSMRDALARRAVRHAG